MRSVSRARVIDGEIVCLDADGRSNFRNLLFRREWLHFAVFDIETNQLRSLSSLQATEPLYQG